MPSTPLLFSSHAPTATANSGAISAQGPVVKGEGESAGGNFLTSFSEAMQQNAPAGTELHSPQVADESFDLNVDAIVAETIVAEATATETADSITLEIPQVDSMSGLLGDLTVMENAALPTPGTLLHVSDDGILADANALPPFAADEAVNPALALNVPPPVTTSTADVPVLDQPNTKRLDLTQWLSSATAGNDPILSEEPVAATPSPSSPIGVFPSVENTDSLLKNALFARALPKAEEFAALESESSPPAISEALAKPLTGSPQAPGFTEIVNTGRITVPMNITFGHPQWPEALAERAAQLAHQRIHSAELQLDPPELGPLQIKISVHQDQAVVSFVSANSQVRDMLDQSLVRLRELLQEQGMQLVDAGVSDQQRESNENAAPGAENLLGAAGEDGTSAIPDTHTTHTQTNITWGVDDFV